ncbi:DivIVA domain-containing protein [Sphaerisporangium corydalis]|uniref:DivIVA domain-containing protein n=1 Tax=Sphaerisporangium corydalis TaxID=1441875 RepID=A0ABV9EQ77_9ACTN|nr:DivIVA domain-containing protein [Sphaerisporangium corydalis]
METVRAVWLESQAARVERVLFRPGRLGAGYNEDEVDVFLDRIVATLRGTTDHPLTAEQVRTATFSTVVFKTGYAVAQVDAFLAEIADVLDRRASMEQGQPA